MAARERAEYDEVLMKFNPKHMSVKHPKRLVIIIISILIVAALATYGTLSYFYWKEFRQNSQVAATSLKTAIDTSLGTDKAPTTPTDEIDAIVTDFNKAYGENPCQVPNWYSWQTLLPQLKTMQSACNDHLATALAVIDTLKPLSQYIKDEKKAADLLTATIKNTKAPTDYAAASATWKAAAASIDLATNDTFKVVKTKTTKVMVAISKAYAALATAVSKEDKAGFDTATADLKTAYDSIDALKTTALLERTSVLKTFISAYDKL